MARGWESKSVAEQIEVAVAEPTQGQRRKLNVEEAATRRHQDLLLMARAGILQRLQASTNDRYRKLLLDELASVEAQIKGATQPRS